MAKHRISAEGRKRIAEASRRRWRKHKAPSVFAEGPRPTAERIFEKVGFETSENEVANSHMPVANSYMPTLASTIKDLRSLFADAARTLEAAETQLGTLERQIGLKDGAD